MSQLLWTNFATTTLAGAITNTSLTATLQPGAGALFPSPGAGQYFVGVFTDAATGLVHEVVWVTNVTGDVITMTRAQEGTTAAAWAAGDLFGLLVTAGTLQNFIQTVNLQSQTTNYAADTGTANAYVVALTPALVAYVPGMPIRVKFANANTGASTLNAGPGSIAITHDDGSALIQGDIVAGMVAEVNYSGGSLILQRNRFSTDAITASGTDLNSAVTPASLASVMLGSPGQTLNNYTTTKFAGTVYTNSTGRPILVMWLITVGPGQSFTLYLNGNVVGGEGNQGPSATNLGSMLVVPNGYTYELVFVGSSTNEWWEVR